FTNFPSAVRNLFITQISLRPPQPADSWWDEHQRSCRGKFTKISEPPKKESKSVKRKRDTNDVDSNAKLDRWFGNKKKVSSENNPLSQEESGVIEINSGDEASSSSGVSSQFAQCPICGNSTIKKSEINEHVNLCILLSEADEELKEPIVL
ncbi:13383_t:CDS:1, partial [Acaulospora colombiana]